MSETISGTVKQVRKYVAGKNLSDEAAAKILDPLAELADDRHVMFEVGKTGDVDCLHQGDNQEECSKQHTEHRREKYGAEKVPG